MTLLTSQKGSASQWKACCGIFRFIIYHRCCHIGAWFVCFKKGSWLPWMPGAVWGADMLEHKWFLCFIFNIPCTAHHVFFFSTYLTSAMYFCLSFVPVSCYTLIIPYSLLNPFGLRWVYFNKLGLSQRWEEEEVYFGWVSCWESEHKCVVLRWKQQRQAHGYISSLTNSVYQFSYPLACLILLWAFKQTKVTADSSRFTGHTRLPSATNNPPPPGSSAFIVSLFAFSPS